MRDPTTGEACALSNGFRVLEFGDLGLGIVPQSWRINWNMKCKLGLYRVYIYISCFKIVFLERENFI